MDEEIIEIVAKSYHAEVGRRSGVNLTWEASYPDEQDSFRRVVADGLAALRAAGFEVHKGGCVRLREPDEIPEAWRVPAERERE